MEAAAVLFALAAVPLAGGQRGSGGYETTGGAHGHYVGVGHFAPKPIWSQIVQTIAPKDPACAKPSDDEQVIIVMDSLTGDVRRCGNHSDQCVGMNPWAPPLARGELAPLAIAKHADQLSAEAAKATVARPTPQ